MTVMFIIAADDYFVIEPTDPLRPMSVHYFSNKKFEWT